MKRIRVLNKFDKFVIASLAVIILIPTILLGLIGLRSILTMMVVFFLPLFAVINNLDLENDEKVFFSIFLSVAMFSLAVWYVNRVIYSLRASVVVTFLLLIIVGLTLTFYKKKKE